VLAVAVAFGMLVLTPSASWACSCAISTTPQHVKAAGTVAAGTVDWTATDGQTRTYKVDFDAVYKGSVAGSEKLSTAANDAACGVGDLATGRRYLFFVEGEHPGMMRLGLCGGTAPYDPALAARVAAITGPPSARLAPRTSSVAGDDGPDGTVTVAVGAAALLALAAGAALFVRRRT
jgi:MYXO-CTERM domain-containing protein